MLKSLIKVKEKDENGQIVEATYLNSLRRYCLSGILVPTQARAIVKLGLAAFSTQPYRAAALPIQGPQDAKTEIYSLVGGQGLTVQGIGQITTTGGNTTVTGTGTKFSSQLQVGDIIVTANGASDTIATVSSDVLATTVGIMAPNSLSNYFVKTTQADDPNLVFVEINDPAWRRSLMNRSVPVTHVFGNALKPLFLSESLLLETNQTFLLSFSNYSTTNRASFGPQCEGRKWQYEAQKNQDVKKFINGLRARKQTAQPYWLTLDDGFVTIPANGSVTKFMTLTGDLTGIFFNLYGSYAASDDPYGHNLISPKIELFDAKTQRQLQAQPLTLYTATGSATNPFVLPTPLIVEPQTQVQVVITNPKNQSINVYLTLHGTAIYTGLNWQGGALTDPAILSESRRLYHETSIPQVIPASPQS